MKKNIVDDAKIAVDKLIKEEEGKYLKVSHKWCSVFVKEIKILVIEKISNEEMVIIITRKVESIDPGWRSAGKERHLESNLWAYLYFEGKLHTLAIVEGIKIETFNYKEIDYDELSKPGNLRIDFVNPGIHRTTLVIKKEGNQIVELYNCCCRGRDDNDPFSMAGW